MFCIRLLIGKAVSYRVRHGDAFLVSSLLGQALRSSVIIMIYLCRVVDACGHVAIGIAIL